MDRTTSAHTGVALEHLEPRLLLSADIVAADLSASTVDDHGNGAASATVVEIDDYVGGTIETLGDVDWFRVEAQADAWYTLQTSSSQPMYSRVIAADGVTVLAEGYETHNVRVEEAGHLFLEVSRPGDEDVPYSVVVFGPDFHGDTPEAATPLVSGDQVSGILYYDSGDEDWFSFEAVEGFRYVFEGLEADALVIDSDGETRLGRSDIDLAVWSDPFVFTAPHDGTFYLQVHNYGEYGYEFTFTEQPHDPPEVVWDHAIPDSIIHEVAVDGAGNVYITGETRGGWAAGGFDTTFNGETDAFVAKLSAEGQMLWSTYLGGSGADVANELVVDGAGNVYLIGSTRSSDWAYGSHTLGGESDAFVAAVSADGQHLWSTNIGGDDPDFGHGIALSDAGELYVTGTTAHEIHRSGIVLDGEAFLVRYDTAGNEIWSQIVDDAKSGNTVAVGPDGSVYVGGDGFGSGSHAYIAKFTAEGDMVWINEGRDIIVAPIDMVAGADGVYYLHAYDLDFGKLSVDGERLWRRSLGWTAMSDDSRSIAIDAHGDLYITGLINSEGVFDGGWDTTRWRQNGYVYKFDSDGNAIWGSYANIAANGIAVDDTGGIYIAGSTNFYPRDGWTGDGFITRIQQDDHGEHLLTASALPVGQSQQGLIEFGADTDLFSFDAIAGRAHTFRLSGLDGGVLRLLDGDGQELLSSANQPGRGPVVWKPSATGTYYLEVSTADGQTGSYVIDSTAPRDGRPGTSDALQLAGLEDLAEGRKLLLERLMARHQAPVSVLDALA